MASPSSSDDGANSTVSHLARLISQAQELRAQAQTARLNLADNLRHSQKLMTDILALLDAFDGPDNHATVLEDLHVSNRKVAQGVDAVRSDIEILADLESRLNQVDLERMRQDQDPTGHSFNPGNLIELETDKADDMTELSASEDERWIPDIVRKYFGLVADIKLHQERLHENIPEQREEKARERDRLKDQDCPPEDSDEAFEETFRQMERETELRIINDQGRAQALRETCINAGHSVEPKDYPKPGSPFVNDGIDRRDIEDWRNDPNIPLASIPLEHPHSRSQSSSRLSGVRPSSNAAQSVRSETQGVSDFSLNSRHQSPNLEPIRNAASRADTHKKHSNTPSRQAALSLPDLRLTTDGDHAHTHPHARGLQLKSERESCESRMPEYFHFGVVFQMAHPREQNQVQQEWLTGVSHDSPLQLATVVKTSSFICDIVLLEAISDLPVPTTSPATTKQLETRFRHSTSEPATPIEREYYQRKEWSQKKLQIITPAYRTNLLATVPTLTPIIKKMDLKTPLTHVGKLNEESMTELSNFVDLIQGTKRNSSEFEERKAAPGTPWPPKELKSRHSHADITLSSPAVSPKLRAKAMSQKGGAARNRASRPEYQTRIPANPTRVRF